MLTGGIGALLYPLVFYYVSYVLIDKRDEFIICTYKEDMEAAAKGEETTDGIRTAILWNLFMICLFLALHFALYQRPDEYATFKTVGVIFVVVCALEIAAALIIFIVVGVSICNGEAYGIAAILSSLAIVIVNALTLVLGTIYFLSKTRTSQARVAVAAAPSRSDDSQSQNLNPRPKPKPQPKEEEEEVVEIAPDNPEDNDGIE